MAGVCAIKKLAGVISVVLLGARISFADAEVVVEHEWIVSKGEVLRPGLLNGMVVARVMHDGLLLWTKNDCVSKRSWKDALIILLKLPDVRRFEKGQEVPFALLNASIKFVGLHRYGNVFIGHRKIPVFVLASKEDVIRAEYKWELEEKREQNRIAEERRQRRIREAQEEERRLVEREQRRLAEEAEQARIAEVLRLQEEEAKEERKRNIWSRLKVKQ